MRLLGVLRVQEDRRRVGRELDLRRLTGRRAARCRRGAPRAASWSSSPIRPPIPTTMRSGRYQVSRYDDERLARRGLDRLPRAEDVPAERLVGVEQPVVDVPDVALRRVEVDVHLLEDHALLLLDLGLVEARMEEHVGEHVERDVARLRAAADVVAGQLLAGERVELAADRVDLGRDRPRGRPTLRALEEHVLGEVGDPLRLGRLVARAGREHDEARHRADLRERRRHDAYAVPERRLLEDRHSRRWYRQPSCPDS